jgi:hypothetical protein
MKTSESVSAEVAPEVTAGQDPPNVRLLKYIVIFLGVLLIGSFVTVFAVIGYRLANPRAPTSKAEVNVIDLPVAAGMQVGQIAMDGDRMAVHLKGVGAEELVVLDVRRGRLISRVKLARPGAGAGP